MNFPKMIFFKTISVENHVPFRKNEFFIREEVRSLKGWEKQPIEYFNHQFGNEI